MEYKLVTNLLPTVHLFADDRQYVLVIRRSEKQSMRNGYHSYFQTLSEVFEELFNYKVRDSMADGSDKTIEEMIVIIKNTKITILEIMKPFEQL